MRLFSTCLRKTRKNSLCTQHVGLFNSIRDYRGENNITWSPATKTTDIKVIRSCVREPSEKLISIYARL